jgi:hypothetical protein
MLVFQRVDKLLLLSVVINMIALPVLTARGANAHRSLTRTVALMLAFNVVYLLAVRYIYPHLL